MDCLIIAAGRGSRLDKGGLPKPLIEINNKPLIEYIIDNVISVGIDKIYVVTGYKTEVIDKQLKQLQKIKSRPIVNLYNPDWEQGNGLSVLAAKNIISDNFILLMSDHLFTGGMLKQLIDCNQKHHNETVLAIDKQIENNPLVDMEDVTRVKVKDDIIVNIGKLINDYNAFDTGMFRSSKYLFEAIEQSVQNGDSSLSGGMRQLRQEKLARTITINQACWIDVDTPAMLEKAKVEVSNNTFN